MKRVVIYARVSTAIQDYDRQIDELKDYANRMNYQVVKVFSEKVSGAKKVAERNALSELLDYVEAHHIDKVLIYECSRLSRRIVDFLQVIERLTEKAYRFTFFKMVWKRYSQTESKIQLHSLYWA